MATYKDRVVKSVTHYYPNPLPLNEEDLGLYLTNPEAVILDTQMVLIGTQSVLVRESTSIKKVLAHG